MAVRHDPSDAIGASAVCRRTLESAVPLSTGATRPGRGLARRRAGGRARRPIAVTAHLHLLALDPGRAQRVDHLVDGVGGTSTSEKRSVISIAPTSRPVSRVSPAIAPTRSCGRTPGRAARRRRRRGRCRRRRSRSAAPCASRPRAPAAPFRALPFRPCPCRGRVTSCGAAASGISSSSDGPATASCASLTAAIATSTTSYSSVRDSTTTPT